jgi:hypothetical protein
LEQEQSIGSVTLLNNNHLTTESNHATEGVLCEKASNTSHSQGLSKTNIITSNQEREFAGKTGPLEDNVCAVVILPFYIVYCILQELSL